MSDVVATDLVVRAQAEGFDAQQAAFNRLAKAENDLQEATRKLDAATQAWASNTDPGKEDQLRAAVLNARVAMDGQAQSVQKLSGEYQDGLTPAVEEAGDAQAGMVRGLADLKAGFDMVVQGVGYAKQAFDATVGAAIEWADTVERVGRATGTGAKESSVLAIALGDFGISAQTVEQAAKALRDEGLTPTIGTLRELARQYQAIEDPAARNEWGTKTLGKAYFTLGEILSKTPEEFDAVAAAASRSAKVLTDEQVEAAQKAALSWKQLGDVWEGIKITIGNDLIQPMTDVIRLGGQFNVAVGRMTGAFTEQEAAARLAALAQDDLTAGFTTGNTYTQTAAASVEVLVRDTDRLTTSTAGAAVAQQDYYTATDAINGALREHQQALDDAAKAQQTKRDQETLSLAVAGPIRQENEKYAGQQAELRVKARDLTAELKRLEDQQGRQYTVTSNSKLSANELALAQLKLSDAQQKLSEATDPMKQAALQVEIDKLTGKISGATTTTSGYIDNSKRIGEIKEELDGVSDAYDANARAHEEATARIVFGFIQQRYAADGLQDGEITALAEIGRAWGIYDEDTARALEAVDKSITEHGTNAMAIIQDVGKAIDGLPDVKTIDIQVRTNGAQVGSEDFGGWTPPTSTAAASPYSQETGPVTLPPGIGGAAGLDLVVPPGYPNDSFGPIWAQSGERVMITPDGGGSPGETIVFNIDARGATMPAAQFRAVVEQALEARGRAADTRRRAGNY